VYFESKHLIFSQSIYINFSDLINTYFIVLGGGRGGGFRGGRGGGGFRGGMYALLEYS